MFVHIADHKDEQQFYQDQWKILAHGEDYFQIHNRATQTCIWMERVCDKWGDCYNVMEMIPCVGANTGVFRVALAIPAVFHSVGLPLKQVYEVDGDGESNPPKCAGLYRDGVQRGSLTPVYWRSCDKLYSHNPRRGEYWGGYDTFDYFEDTLGQRRYVSKHAPGSCLSMLENSGTWGRFNYADCDSTDPRQWLLATQVVGGLTLTTTGDKFPDPDPKKIIYQPLNPRAGVEWSDPVGSGYTGTGFDTAYTSAQQATSAINTRATAWGGAAIKTGLAAKSNELAAGKQACVKSGKKNYCYLLGPQTGYVARAVPAGQTPTQLTDGTPIIADDVSDAQARKLAAVATMKEPKWFLCRTYIGGRQGIEMTMPGVVVNLNNCIYSIGKRTYNQKHCDTGFKVVKVGTDLFWQPAGNGFLPASAVITGISTEAIGTEHWYAFDFKGSIMSAYSCRAMIDRRTKIGWTIDGKYCHITTFSGGAVVKNFEVLAVNGSIAAPPPPPPNARISWSRTIYRDGRKHSARSISTICCTRIATFIHVEMDGAIMAHRRMIHIDRLLKGISGSGDQSVG